MIKPLISSYFINLYIFCRLEVIVIGNFQEHGAAIFQHLKTHFITLLVCDVEKFGIQHFDAPLANKRRYFRLNFGIYGCEN